MTDPSEDRPIHQRWPTVSSHRMSEATSRTGTELLGWCCVKCGGWIREYGPIDRTTCPGPPPLTEEHPVNDFSEPIIHDEGDKVRIEWTRRGRHATTLVSDTLVEQWVASENERRALSRSLQSADALIVRFMCGDGPIDWEDTGLSADLQAWVQAIPENERAALLRAMPDLLDPPVEENQP